MDIQVAVVLVGSILGAAAGGFWMAVKGASVPDRSEKYQERIAANNGNGASYLRTASDEAARALTDSNLNLSVAISQILRQSESDKAERAALLEKLERLERQIEHHDRETGVMQTSIHALEDQLIAKTREIAALQRADGDNKRQINRLEGEVAALRKENAQLVAELKERTKERDAALAQVVALEENMIDMSLRIEDIGKKQTDELRKLEDVNHENESKD